MRTIRSYLGLVFAWLSEATQPYMSDLWTLWFASMSYRVLHPKDREFHPAGERAVWLYQQRRAIKLINEINNDRFNRY